MGEIRFVTDTEQFLSENKGLVYGTIKEFNFDTIFGKNMTYDEILQIGMTAFNQAATIFCGEARAFAGYARKDIHSALMEKYRRSFEQETLDNFLKTKKKNDTIRLVTDNMGLVHSVIRRNNFETTLGYCMDYDDLVQIGSMALLRAAETFNGESKFSTYAYKVILNALTDEYRRRSKDLKQEYIFLDADNGKEILSATVGGIDDQLIMSEKHIMMLITQAKSRYAGVTLKGIEALVLRANGYQVREIAQMYDSKSNHVGAWISRAATCLRKDEAFVELMSV